MNRRTRLIDVAKMTNVSTATVSHVINNTRFVREETRRRVLSAIKKLHYYPSDTARSLATKRTKTIGVIISDIHNPFYGPLIRGIEEVLQKFGYNILFVSNNENAVKQKANLRTFFCRGIDGLILAPVGEDISFLEVMESVGTQVVFIDRVPKNNPFTSVVVDNRESSAKLVNHLIDDGHERIAIILGMPRSTTEERLTGYKEALLKRGIPFNKELVVVGGSQQRGGYMAARKLLEDRKKRPTAIFATVNLMTLGTLFAIREMNLKCPDEIALVGFDDFSWASIFHPPLTTIRQPAREMGTTAATMMLRLLHEKKKLGTLKLRTSLEIRGSCSLKCLNDYRVRQTEEIR